MIQIENLRKKYGKKEVVSNISLSVAKGDVLGFIGPNGAGKSTTIKMVSGVLPIYDGRIRIDGIDLAESPRKAKNKIGYLPENAPLPPNMTVLAFLKYVAAMRGISFFKRRAAVMDAVRNCALEDVLEQEIESLSKGYKRRVCFAQAIIHKPPVLLLDEPTDGLDPNQKREIRNLIQTLSKDTAVIISTHILEEVRSVCTKVVLLAAGKIAFQGKTAEFTALEKELRCIALTFAPEQIHTATELLQTKFPGSARLDGETIVLPEDLANDPNLPKLFNETGLTVVKQISCPATLDDVFAHLTRLKKEKKAPSPVEPPAADIPANPQVEEGENDDD